MTTPFDERIDLAQLSIAPKGQTFVEFAEECHLDPEAFHCELDRIERDPRATLRIDFAHKIAARTGCDIQWLLTGRGEPGIRVDPETARRAAESREIARRTRPRW